MSEAPTESEELDVSRITKPSLQRLARMAGVKTMSADCSEVLRTLLAEEAEKICCAMLVYNSQRKTKTIMIEDLHAALHERGSWVATSNSISDSICSAKG